MDGVYKIGNGPVLDSQGGRASAGGVLAAALEANEQLTRLVAELREENAALRAQNARQAAELEWSVPDLVDTRLSGLLLR